MGERETEPMSQGGKETTEEDDSEARKREPHYSAVRSQLSLVPAIVYTRLQN